MLFRSQVAEGLSAAHAAGITHGDIRSSNVFVTVGGQAMILDFGLAEAAHEAGSFAYLSPEQARGEAPDARTDVWYLGALLFEAITSALPFRRSDDPNDPARFDQTVPLSTIRPDIDKGLEAAISKALSSDPSERWQTAAEFASQLQPYKDLRTAPIQVAPPAAKGGMDVSETGESATPSIHRAILDAVVKHWRVLALLGVIYGVAIFGVKTFGKTTGKPQMKLAPSEVNEELAVLPFKIAEIGEQGAILSEGLRAVLMDKFGARKPSGGRPQIRWGDGAEAKDYEGVDLVLTGEVSEKDGKLSFDMKLLETATGKQTGSTTFEVDPTDPRQAIDQAIQGTGKMLKMESASSPYGQSPDAYAAYVEGMGFLAHAETAGNVDRAIEAFHKAVGKDPKFAKAWEGLGEAYALKDTPEEQVLAVKSAERAVQEDPELTNAHALLGKLHAKAGRTEDAIRELKTALEQQPTLSDASMDLAKVYSNSGKLKEAEETYRKAIEARKHDYYGYYMLGLFYAENERYPEAETQLKKAAELAPANETVARELGGVYLREAKYQEAVDSLKKACGAGKDRSEEHTSELQSH